MKRTIDRITIAFAVLVCLCSRAIAAPQTLIPVGNTVGIHLCGEMTVAALEDCARAAGVRVGDRIIAVNGTPARSIDELHALIGDGETVHLEIERDGKKLEYALEPTPTADGARIGIRVRDGITGVGTVTFYDPQTGCFGALGHGVNDPEGGQRIRCTGGSIMSCRVTDVERGSTGAPGQLHGAFTKEQSIGSIAINTDAGIFGTMDTPDAPMEPMPVAQTDAVHPGSAMILSNVNGTQVHSYAVEILKIDKSNAAGRNYLLQVCDEALISRTGGIVQGMSGSPIIQDGQLIGAVTHVLVDDPTIGYGISIETMLEAANAALHPEEMKTFFESRKFLLSNRHNYYRIGGK